MRVPKRKLLALIDTIQRAALEPEAWTETVHSLHALFPETSVHLQGYQLADREVLLTVQAGFDQSAIDEYRAHWTDRNPYPALIPQMAVGMPVIAEESRYIEEVRKTPFYNEFALKHDIGSAVGVPLWCTSGRVCFLAFDYPNRRSARISRPIASLAGIIASHLARAFEVSHRLASIPHGNVQLAALIRRIAGPALIVDGHRRLRLANAAGEALLRSARGLRLDRHGAVVLADASADAGLAMALRACFEPNLVAEPCAISFRTGDRGAVGWLDVVPLVADDSTGKGPLARFLAERERLALLIASTLSEPSPDIAARLRATFLMTPAEARLAMALMEGTSIETYARDRGIAVNTARNQLQSLFEKTETHRQGELIAVLFAEVGRH